MRSTTIVAVSCLVLLAGCSGFTDSSSSTPTSVETSTVGETTSTTPTEQAGSAETATQGYTQTQTQTTTGPNTTVPDSVSSPPGVANDSVRNITVLTAAYQGHVATGNTTFELNVTDNEREYRFALKNDSTNKWYQIERADELSTYYITAKGSDGKLYRNGSTEYTGPGNALLMEASLNMQIVETYVGYINYLEWNSSGVEMQNGQPVYILTANSLTDEAIANEDATDIETENMETVTGRLTVTPSGGVVDGEITLRSPNENVNITYAYTPLNSTVEQPDWFTPPN